MTDLVACLFPCWTPELGRKGIPYNDRYNVLMDGERIVTRSRNPDTDVARALLARGITGKLTILDGEAKTPRLRLDIERAAKITVSEDQRRMRFVKWKPMPTDAHPKVDESGEGRPQTAEEGNPFAQVHSGNQEAA